MHCNAPVEDSRATVRRVRIAESMVVVDVVVDMVVILGKYAWGVKHTMISLLALVVFFFFFFYGLN